MRCQKKNQPLKPHSGKISPYKTKLTLSSPRKKKSKFEEILKPIALKREWKAGKKKRDRERMQLDESKARMKLMNFQQNTKNKCIQNEVIMLMAQRERHEYDENL